MVERPRKSIVKSRKALLIRLDKIGDLICTLPADCALPEFECTWVISQGLEPLVEASAPPRKYIALNKSRVSENLQILRRWLRQEQPELAISFQAPWWVSYALWREGVPQRFGVKSQWHSFLFLNHGIRQRRSLAEKHEYDYNLDLCNAARRLNHLPAYDKKDFLRLEAPNTLDSQFSNGELKDPTRVTTPYIVVHPGMAGSALNWSQEKYIQWMESFLVEQADHRIFLTGTQMDEPSLDKIKLHFAQNSRVEVWQNRLDLKSLMRVIKLAEFVVAPSTGVAHIAAALGTPIKSIFSPVRVHNQIRWAPRGPGKIQIYAPNVNCPGKRACLESNCRHYNCMDTVELS